METMKILAILVTALAGVCLADITGTNPAAGTCLCFYYDSVNVRDGPCSTTVIGQSSTGACFKYNGNKQTCQLSGVTYDFFDLQWGSGSGWSAGTFLQVADNQDRCNRDDGVGVCGDVEIVSRAAWGARSPAYNIGPLPSKPVNKAFIHHTVTGHCYDQATCSSIMRSVQNYHMDTNGWPDIAYNFLVGEDGRAYEGRGWDKLGAHTCGYNDNAVAVCVIGNFEANPAPNEATLRAVKNILDCAMNQGVLVQWNGLNLHGHRNGGCTACPGINLYNVITTWPWFAGELSKPCCFNAQEYSLPEHMARG
jgi:N-acetylmuramoyl-L-alanine amidase